MRKTTFTMWGFWSEISSLSSGSVSISNSITLFEKVVMQIIVMRRNKGKGVLKQNVDDRLFLPLICFIGLRGCFLQNICRCWENDLTRQWLNFDFLSCFCIDWRSKTYFSNICWALGKIIWWVNNLTLVPSCFCIGWRGQSSSEWCAQGHMDRCLVIMMFREIFKKLNT